MRAFILISALSLPFLLAAQKYDYVWMQGNNSNFYIDFESLFPHVYTIDREYEFNSTLLLANNYDGKPIFYSNGCNIQNIDNQVIEDGDSLLQADYFCDNNGFQNIRHGLFSIPSFAPNTFIVLGISYGNPLMSQPCEANRLIMHAVDMSIPPGVGKVTEKSQVLLSGCFQEPTANKHANGRDWWILLPDNQQERFYRWLFTPSGIEGPWIQEMSNETLDGYWYCGWSEFSPNGEKYLINACRKGVEVYDFDRCTGLLSNPLFIQRNTSWNFGAAFSPNNQFLYTLDTSSKVLLQYDLNDVNVSGSKTVLGVWDGKIDAFFTPAVFGCFQHGPNGKLYVWGGGSSIMHVIDFPDRKGLDCRLQQYAIQMPATCSNANLYYPHYRLGPVDGSSCDTLGIDNLPVALFRYDLEDSLNPLQITFTDVSSYEPSSWHWTFGDGTVSTAVNPVHTYTQAGSYEVCLIVSNAFAADTFCRQVQVGLTGVNTLPALPHARVLPSPFSTEIQIQQPAMVGVLPEFVLYDLYGRVVKKARLSDFETFISVPELPSGLYVWQLSWNQTITQTGKLVKQ